MTNEQYDSTADTLEHIEEVRRRLQAVISQLGVRALLHDRSKLESPEKEAFDEFTPKMRGLTYGSDEYKACLDAMKPALEHHYANNRHHPEWHACLECNGCFKLFDLTYDKPCDVCGYGQFSRRFRVRRMTLLDLVEMLCDWKAATLRHADGDIRRSIQQNQSRFGYSDELKDILLNTLADIGE